MVKIASVEFPAGGGGRTAKYDRIGAGYREVRRPDRRLAALIAGALGDARTVVNVGAGAGSYEPEGREVTAVDPSRVMLDQHPGTRKVLAGAEQLPFVDGAFDAAMAVMTVHHWPDRRAGWRSCGGSPGARPSSPGIRSTGRSCGSSRSTCRRSGSSTAPPSPRCPW